MRYREGHKDETRRRLVDAAAMALRRDGFDKLGVAQVMGEVGLTHGGFYAHFPSRSALVASALARAFAQSRDRFRRLAARLSPDDYLDQFVDRYVSAEHRDRPEGGCPLTSLTAGLPRQDVLTRAAFDEGVRDMIRGLAGRLVHTPEEAREPLALSLLAEMAGAVTLARAVSDRAFSDLLLEQTRAKVKARMGLKPQAQGADHV